AGRRAVAGNQPGLVDRALPGSLAAHTLCRHPAHRSQALVSTDPLSKRYPTRTLPGPEPAGAPQGLPAPADQLTATGLLAAAHPAELQRPQRAACRRSVRYPER